MHIYRQKGKNAHSSPTLAFSSSYRSTSCYPYTYIHNYICWFCLPPSSAPSPTAGKVDRWKDPLSVYLAIMAHTFRHSYHLCTSESLRECIIMMMIMPAICVHLNTSYYTKKKEASYATHLWFLFSPQFHSQPRPSLSFRPTPFSLPSSKTPSSRPF